MKNLLFLSFALLLSASVYGQTEVKINPVGLLFGSFNVLVEVPASETFGIEGKVGFFSRNNDLFDNEWNYSAFNLEGAGKFYFNPREGFDRFYVGPYLKFNTGSWDNDNNSDSGTNTRVSLGILFGQKWVAQNGIVFELGLGIGRALVNTIDNDSLDDLLFDIDLTGRLAIGYRFGSK